MSMSAPARDELVQQLERVLGSALFRTGGRSGQLLRFLVEHSLNGNQETLKEYTIGAEVLGRGDSFDPRIDSIVRVEASRLRGKLDQYFASEGKSDAFVIRLPKGGYVPTFERRPHTVPVKTPLRLLVLTALTSAALASVVILLIWRPWRTPTAQVSPVVQFESELWSEGELGSAAGTHLVLSPDGSRVVFIAFNASGVPQLHTRRLDELEIALMPGTEGARNPFFSPDGQWIGFWSDRKLKKTPISGGVPIVICEASDMLGGSWGDNGNILLSLTAEPKLWLVPSSGGTPQVAVELPREVNRSVWPQVLPGSTAVLYTATGDRGGDAASIEVISLADRKRKVLVRGGTFGRYIASGHLVYINQGTLYAVAFDLTRLEVLGSPVPVVSNVAYNPIFGFGQYDFSQTGILAYRRSSSRGEVTAKWLNGYDRASPIFTNPGPYLWPRLSPDGRTLALTRSDSDGSHLWLSDTANGKLSALPSASKTQLSPVWTPDGRFILFSGVKTVEWMATDGSERKGTLLRSRTIQIPWSLTANGRLLAFHQLDPATHFDLWIVPLKEQDGQLSAGEPLAILKTPAIETYPTFSPDGHWLAYTSNRSGNYEVYVRAFPEGHTDVQISVGGGRCPRWRPGLKQIVYSSTDRQVMIVPYRITGGRFEVDAPRPWSKIQLADTNVFPAYDLGVDGRIVALLPPDPAPHQRRNHVTFVMNSFDEIRRRVGTNNR